MNSSPPPPPEPSGPHPAAGHATRVPPPPEQNTPLPGVIPSSLEGRTFGAYQLLTRLGGGGMGEVFEAVHLKLNRRVAVKLIRTDLSDSATALRRFRREVQSIARLSHPFIVRAFDAGCVNDRYYLAMELVDGIALDTQVQRHGPLPIPAVQRVAVELATALNLLHEHGLVHRDLKPSNVLRDRHTGSVKLLDLGLARLRATAGDPAESSVMTQVGIILGTPDFMAPEQAMNAQSADIRSDLYSLGCTLHFLACGRSPFPGGTSVEKMLRHCHEAPPRTRSLRPDLPERLDAIIARLLAKNPRQRPQTPGELLAELSFAGNGLAAPPPPPPPPALPADEGDFFFDDLPESGPASLPSRSPSVRPPRPFRTALPLKRPIAWAAGGSLLLMLAFFLSRPSRGPEASPAAPPPAGDPASTVRSELWERLERAPAGRDFVTAAGELRKHPSPLEQLLRDARGVITLGDGRQRHAGKIHALALSADGSTLVSGGEDRTVRVWATDGMKLRAILSGHQTPIYSVAVSADGSLAAGSSRFDTGEGGGVSHERMAILWEVKTGRERQRFHFNREGWTVSVGFAPDQSRLLLGQFDGVGVWDLDENLRSRTLRAAGMDWTFAMALSPDGTRLVTGGNYRNQVRIWDLARGKLLHECPGHYGSIRAVAVDPTGRVAASIGQDHAVRLWSMQGGKLEESIELGEEIPRCLCWSDDGNELAIGLESGKVRFRAARPGAARAELLCGGPVSGCAWRGETLWTASEEGVIRKWNLATAAEVAPVDGGFPAAGLAFVERDRRWVELPRRGPPRGVDPLQPIPTLPADLNLLETPVGLSEDGFALTRSGERAIHRWSPGNPKPERFDAPAGFAAAEAIALGGGARQLLYAPANRRSLQLHELDPTGRTLTLEGASGELRLSALSAGGDLAAAADGEGEVSIWSLPSGGLLKQIPLKNPRLRQIRFAPDGQALYLLDANSVTSIRVDANERPRVTPLGRADATVLAVAPDQQHLAVGTEKGEVLLLPLGAGFRSTLAGKVRVSALAFARGTRVLAVAQLDGVTRLVRYDP